MSPVRGHPVTHFYTIAWTYSTMMGAVNSATPGPSRPAPQPALPPARARVAAMLDDLGDDVPLAELARRIGGHPNATRAHLEALVEDGLAEARPRPSSGPGRPALGWSLTEAGRRAIAGDPAATAYAEIVAAVVAHLDEIPDAEGLARSIGQTWGADRVTAPSPASLVEALTDLGFDPEVDGDGIRLRSCPILDAAQANPRVVCAIHAGLVFGASGNERTRLRPFAEPGACRIDVA